MTSFDALREFDRLSREVFAIAVSVPIMLIDAVRHSEQILVTLVIGGTPRQPVHDAVADRADVQGNVIDISTPRRAKSLSATKARHGRIGRFEFQRAQSFPFL